MLVTFSFPDCRNVPPGKLRAFNVNVATGLVAVEFLKVRSGINLFANIKESPSPSSIPLDSMNAFSAVSGTVLPSLNPNSW